MTQLFILTEADFSYNDEVYSLEGEGGRPIQAFESEEDAKAAVVTRTAEWVKSHDLGTYGYDMEDLFARKPAFVTDDDRAFWSGGGDGCAYDYCYHLFGPETDLSDSDFAEVARCLNFSPFSVFKVTVS